MKKRLYGVSSLLLLMAAVFVVPEDANALSAFARKEGVPCGTCHYRINRLNQVGLNYMRQGFTFNVGDTKAPEPKLEETGKYFSVLANIDVYKKNQGADYTSSVSNVTLYGGGALGSDFSFLLETTVAPSDAQEVADAYLQYTPGNDDKYAFIRAGRMLPMLFQAENTWEFANDRSTAFVRDRRIGVAAGYNFGKAWAELAALTPGGGSTNNKVDFVANAQYIFTPTGSSLGAYYWNGNVYLNATDPYYVLNPGTGTIDRIPGTPATSDRFSRYGVVGQYNQIDNLLLSAGYSQGKGDSSAGGDQKIQGLFGQVEYNLFDRASVLLNVVGEKPDTSASNVRTTTYTLAGYYWLAKYASVDLRYVYQALPDARHDSQVKLRVRFMY